MKSNKLNSFAYYIRVDIWWYITLNSEEAIKEEEN